MKTCAPLDGISLDHTPNPPRIYPAALTYGIRYTDNGRARVVGRAGSVEVEVVPPCHYSDALARWYSLTGRDKSDVG